MSHCLMSMLIMQNPTKSFGRVIWRIQNTSDVSHENITLLAPFLYCKKLDIDVSRMCCRFALVDQSNCCLVVFIDDCRMLLSKSKIF